MAEQNIWCRCGSCKKPIGLSAKYYACSVSTCKKTAYCSVPCFEDHLPILRHKDAWAEEHVSPKTASDNPQEGTASRMETARLVAPSNLGQPNQEASRDILIVASKLKDYIRVQSGMNTSANVLERLSDMVRLQCNKAIERAQKDNRKTVMDRDFFF